MLGKTLTLLSLITLISCGSDELKPQEESTPSYDELTFSHDIFDFDKNLKITVESKKEKVAVKIKKKKNSFEIKTKNKATFLSKKAFSLFNIADSTEFEKLAQLNVFQEALQNQGLIGLKSKIVIVNTPGNNNEMYFQEGFDKRVIESNSNREGIVFTFSDQTKIEYNPSDKEDEELSAPINNRIKQWVDGDLNTECLVDVYKYGRFLAISEAFSINKIENLNTGYYLNPVSNLIEPFLYLDSKSVADGFSEKLNSDSTLGVFKILSKEQISEVNKVIQDHKLGEFTARIENEIGTVSNPHLENCYSTENFEKYFKETDGVFVLNQQTNTINTPVIIPGGLKVKFNAGDNIDIQKGGFILSFSPVQMKGSKENPIKIFSSDSLGSGFHVINARAKSQLEYVDFDGLSNLKYKSWKLPSAVTFYESPVAINYCTFSNNHCEDAVNIFRSTPYTFSNSTIANTFSDAFDADFSNGLIENCTFVNSGNDGVDISGSEIIIKNTTFTNIADKALSAGENSTMDIDAISVDGASLAIVAKDLSSVDIKNSTITNSEVVYCAFQKKSEFGASEISASKVKYTKFKEENLIEEGSKLKVDGEKIHNYRNDVRKYLYGNEYGKETVK